MQTKNGLDNSTLERRVDLPCNAAGFEVPPCNVSLKFVPGDGSWTVLALTTPDQVVAVGRWLQAHKPMSVQYAAGLAPKVVRADFATLPERWANLVSMVRLHHVECSPAGVTSLFIESTKTQMDKMLATGGTDPTEARTRQANLRHDHSQIRPRQLQALATAVALGYYEIPHRVDLRQIAEKMDLSLGSVSELLRRAEAAVVNAYVDSMAASQWERVGDGAWSAAFEISRPEGAILDFHNNHRSQAESKDGSTAALAPSGSRANPVPASGVSAPAFAPSFL